MTISYAHHQYPPIVLIRHAVWLYLRFTLSFRDVEDLLDERGLDISDETVRRWATKFGPQFARELRNRRPKPTSRWRLDEMVVSIAGRHFWLWRAVDDEGEVLDLLVQRRRDNPAGGKELLRKLLKRQGFAPELLVTDRLRSYAAAKVRAGMSARHEQGLGARTIELRIRISRPDEGRGRCKGSKRGIRAKIFSQYMQQPIYILSTSSAISPQQERTEPSGHKLSVLGELR